MVSDRVSDITMSQTIGLTALADDLKKKGEDVVAFTAGQPDFDTPQHIKDAAIRSINDGKTKYTAAEGILELRQAISKKFKQDNGLDYDASEIVVSCGAKHTLANVFLAILNKGDEVVIPSPYWVSYPEQVKIADGKCVFVETDDDCSLNIDNIKDAITEKTKAIVINTPNNPSGAVFSEESLKEVAELAVKNDFYIISDECYEKLVYEGKHVSIANFAKDKTITVNAVSKTYSMTGWRLGYCAGPKDIMTAIKRVQSHMTSNPSNPSQYAALEALTGKQEFFSEWIDKFKKRRELLTSYLDKMKDISYIKPEGAFYCFVDISKKSNDSMTFCKELLEKEKVVAVPGVAFGREGFIRLSYAVSVDQIEKGMERLARFLE